MDLGITYRYMWTHQRFTMMITYYSLDYFNILKADCCRLKKTNTELYDEVVDNVHISTQL